MESGILNPQALFEKHRIVPFYPSLRVRTYISTYSCTVRNENLNDARDESRVCHKIPPAPGATMEGDESSIGDSEGASSLDHALLESLFYNEML